MNTSTKESSLYNQVAFARWGNTVRPLVVLNPYHDVPLYIREQWEDFPMSQDFQICCWIGGKIMYLPRRSIINYDTGVTQGYPTAPLLRHSVLLRPLDNYVDRKTQLAVEMLDSVLEALPKQRVQAVTQCLLFYNTVY